MKKLLIILTLMFLRAPYAWSELSEKETAFVEMHKVSDKEQTIINEIFGSLDQKLLDLLDGKDPVMSTEEYKKLFEQAGFTIHNLHIVQNENFRIDTYPKRVILKHKKLPDYFIKIGFDLEHPQKNISRVMYTYLINNLVDDPKLNITSIKKIYKKLCLRPGRPNDNLIDTNYVVLSPEQKGRLVSSNIFTKKKGSEEKKFFHVETKKQLEDCSLLKNLLRMWDFTESNIIFTEDGKIAFIDTEIVQDHFIKFLFEEKLETSNSKLNRRKAAFIEENKARDDVQKIIDEIFGSLDQKLLDLLDGKDPVMSTEEYRKLFEQAGFTVYNLRIHQNKTFRFDAYPKRVVLKHKKLPNCFIKIGFDLEYPLKNISRIMYAGIINGLIDNPHLNITTIKKLHKALCLRPGRSNDYLKDTNYIVLSPEQKGKVLPDLLDENGKVRIALETEKQVKDFTTLMNAARISDLHGHNIMITEDGKIALIDTEIIPDRIINNFFEKLITIVD